MKTAAVAYIERHDGRILCVWNQRYGGWGFPGGLVEESETAEMALAREIKEETGCEPISATLLFTGPHGIPNKDKSRASQISLFRVDIKGEPKETEVGCPVTWLTQDQFLEWSPFRKLYKKLFPKIPPRQHYPSLPAPKGIPMLIWCPECGARHIDEGEFATRDHHTHSCQTCGLTWRPAVVPTTGVRFLPGFKSDPPPLDIEKIAKALGAERRGKFLAESGYFGAQQAAAEWLRRKPV